MEKEQNNIEKQETGESNLNSLNTPPKEKKNPIGGIIIVLLVLVILGLVCYIAYDKGYLDKLLGNETKETSKEDEKESKGKKSEGKESEEKEETKEELKDDFEDLSSEEKIKRQQEILKLYTKESLVWRVSNIYEKDITNSELDPSMKLISVLYYLSGNGEFKEIGDEYSDLAPTDPEKDYVTVRIVSASRVKELYKRVYGDELSTKTPIIDNANDIMSYNQKYDVYVEYAGYGGTCVSHTDTYDYDYEEDDNYYYVYSALAMVTCEGIYKDFNKSEIYKESEDGERFPDYNIEDEYNNFHQYKITYNKDFTFNKIEKIK